jgi:hypothetical protein
VETHGRAIKLGEEEPPAQPSVMALGNEVR